MRINYVTFILLEFIHVMIMRMEKFFDCET